MIYIQHGLASNEMHPAKHDLAGCLKKAERLEPISITPQNLKAQKYAAFYAITGEMTGTTRAKSNIQARDVLALDFDQVSPSIPDMNTLESQIKAAFNGYQWYLYPTISNGIKGLRARLLLPLDQPVNKADYKTLTAGVTNQLIKNDILSAADASSFSFAQLFGLPVRTQYTQGQLVRENAGALFPVGRFLAPFKAEIEAHRQVKRPFFVAGRLTNTRRTYTGDLLETILKGIPQGTENGGKGRNATLYEFSCFWLRSQGIRNIAGFRTFLDGVNAEFCQPPLSEHELDQVINSALRGVTK